MIDLQKIRDAMIAHHLNTNPATQKETWEAATGACVLQACEMVNWIDEAKRIFTGHLFGGGRMTVASVEQIRRLLEQLKTEEPK